MTMPSIKEHAMQLLGVNGEEMPQMQGSLKDKTLNLLGMDDDERAMQSEAHFAQLSQQLSAQIAESMNAAMAQMAQHMAMLNSMLQQIVALNQQAVAELNKPKAISIKNVKTGPDGRIIGADINSSIQ